MWGTVEQVGARVPEHTRQRSALPDVPAQADHWQSAGELRAAAKFLSVRMVGRL